MEDGRQHRRTSRANTGDIVVANNNRGDRGGGGQRKGCRACVPSKLGALHTSPLPNISAAAASGEESRTSDRVPASSRLREPRRNRLMIALGALSLVAATRFFFPARDRQHFTLDKERLIQRLGFLVVVIVTRKYRYCI